jgi:hypothetical protein
MFLVGAGAIALYSWSQINTYLKQFTNVSDVQLIRRWTKKQAKQMAFGKYRDKYG